MVASDEGFREIALEARQIILRRGSAKIEVERIALEKGEIAALCGPSGAGKSLLLWGLAGLGEAKGITIQSQEFRLLHRRTGFPDVRISSGEIALMPQPPEETLDPYRRTLVQIAQMLQCHGEAQASAALRRAEEMLERVGFATTAFHRHPHELSGGMAQIAAVLLAIAADAPILMLDEPFSRLNPRTAEAVRALLTETAASGKAVLYATHEVQEALTFARRLHIIYGGRLVETLPTSMATRACHPYTRALVSAALGLDMPAPSVLFDDSPPAGCVFFRSCERRRPRCECLPPPWQETASGGYACHYPCEGEVHGQQPAKEHSRPATSGRIAFAATNLWWRYDRHGEDVLCGLDLAIEAGEIVAIVGGNGSGKSTLCALAGGLLTAQRGRLEWFGAPLPRRRRGRIVQWLPQNPVDAFDPRQRIRAALVEPIVGLDLARGEKEALACYADLFVCLGLPWDVLDRVCGEASHGQLLRLALARALACDPAMLVCDEVTAGLDVILARATMEWVVGWAQERQRTILWVTHDMRLASKYAHRVLRIEGGRLSHTH